jgi:hypothetical protein
VANRGIAGSGEFDSGELMACCIASAAGPFLFLIDKCGTEVGDGRAVKIRKNVGGAHPWNMHQAFTVDTVTRIRAFLLAHTP